MKQHSRLAHCRLCRVASALRPRVPPLSVAELLNQRTGNHGWMKPYAGSRAAFLLANCRPSPDWLAHLNRTTSSCSEQSDRLWRSYLPKVRPHCPRGLEECATRWPGVESPWQNGNEHERQRSGQEFLQRRTTPLHTRQNVHVQLHLQIRRHE